MHGSAPGTDLRSALSSRSLQLILMPTERCNFRCVYCYESFESGRMPARVREGITHLLKLRAPGLDHLTVSWFGGEPLLALDVISEISSVSLELVKQYPMLKYRSDITTNGYHLTRGVFESLLAWGVRSFQISFDGPKESHDKKRLLADGRGSFDRLWSNLERIKSVSGEFSITVRLHVDAENAGACSGFVEGFKESFGTDRRFSLFMRALSRLGGPNDPHLRVLEGQELDDALTNLRTRARELGVSARTPVRSAVDASTSCYAARLNSFLIRSDGRVGKCTVALNDPRNDVGWLNADGTITVDQDRARWWSRGLASGDTDQLTCPLWATSDAFEGTGNTVLLPMVVAVP